MTVASVSGEQPNDNSFGPHPNGRALWSTAQDTNKIGRITKRISLGMIFIGIVTLLSALVYIMARRRAGVCARVILFILIQH